MVRVIDRLLLFLFSLTGTVAAILMIIVSFLADHPLYDLLELEEVPNLTAVLAGSAVLLLISIRFLYISTRFSEGKPSSIDQRTDFGDISISLDTIENLTLRAAGRVKGVKDLKARVSFDQSGIYLKIRTFVDGDRAIPALTEEVQQVVKEYIEELTGIPVSQVSVFVANIVPSSTIKSRVE
ncbi:alkaline shock response membrane anchor protein AmaP [Marinicrinis sediminis]|uniref:Alkaline shock response membrane anchor protein AmaP n=1 Tax=Marinicrinis sediminis TaxID=1652465 RepID=A0ABW5RD71_9BACL